jgi:DNA-directed RNA polymerase subunit omega
MIPARNTLMEPPIEDLLDKVDSKFTLVVLGASRAREVNAYYNHLGQGLGRVVPPQVTSVSGKPVSIALEEIAAGKATYAREDPASLLEETDEVDSGAELTDLGEVDSIAGLAALEVVTGAPADEDPLTESITDLEDEGPATE